LKAKLFKISGTRFFSPTEFCSVLLERFPSTRSVLSVGEASLARRAKQATPLRVVDAARQSQAQLQPAQHATSGWKPF